MPDNRLTFTPDDLFLITEALDSHMYWQIATEDQRRDGFVVYDDTDENAEELAACERLIATIEQHVMPDDPEAPAPPKRKQRAHQQ